MFIELNRILNLIYLTIKPGGYHLGEGGPSSVFISKERKAISIKSLLFSKPFCSGALNFHTIFF